MIKDIEIRMVGTSQDVKLFKKIFNFYFDNKFHLKIVQPNTTIALTLAIRPILPYAKAFCLMQRETNLLILHFALLTVRAGRLQKEKREEKENDNT